MDDGWQQVLGSAHLGGVSPAVTVTAGSLRPDAVAVTIEAHGSDPVWFGDGLYGATAWAWDGGAWRRADVAEMRTMIAPSLAPGERAEVTLPLAGAPARVRVLVPAQGLGAWTELTA